MSFIKEIESKDKNLFEYVSTQIDLVKPKLNQIETIFEEYTDHYASHSEKVLEIGENLNSCELNIYEKAIFILATYFHDIEMAISKEEIDTLINELGDDYNIDYYLNNVCIKEKLYSESIERQKKFLALNHFREIHSNLSAKYIRENYPNDREKHWFQDIYLWEYVASVCKAHAEKIEDIEKNPEYTIDALLENNVQMNILYLILLLRLSDVCHFSRDRAYPFFFKNKISLSKKSGSIWKYYSDVVTTFPDIKSKTIRIQAKCKDFYNHRAIINNTKYIQKELFNCHCLLNKSKSDYQFDWKYVDVTGVVKSHAATYQYFDTKFKLDQKKIITLLMGEKLYSDKLYAIRECIQNSIDACKIIDKKVPSKNYIYLDYHTNKNPILYIFDTGTGMTKDIINNYFLSVGSNSYWHTESFFKEWKIPKKEMKLIADHGIGALSYFMLANAIEIYSKYHFSEEYIHVFIDNYEDGIIFKNTSKDEFPRFKTKYNLYSPWDINHGTCIKFHLKEKLSFDALLHFLSVHILRITPKLYLNYSGYELELLKVWHYRENYDRHCYKKSNALYYWGIFEENEYPLQNKKSKEDIYSIYYEKKPDFYENPPNDKGITDNDINHENIEGKIHLNYYNEDTMPIRISQNGILIKSAIDFIFENKKDFTLINGFGFDIDIKGDFIFQLDAERTSIIDNEYNKNMLEKIEKIVVEKYYKQISKIESPIYFKCGGKFYHGFGDVIFNHPDSVKCFNANLKYTFLDNQTNYRKIELQKMNYLKSAKLFLMGKNRNQPVCVKDILEDTKEYKLLIIKDDYIQILFRNNRSIDLEETYDSTEYDSDSQKMIDDINTFIENIYEKYGEPLIYLPDGIDTFILPLVFYLDFDVIDNTGKITVMNVLKKNKRTLHEKLNLFIEFLKHKNRNFA